MVGGSKHPLAKPSQSLIKPSFFSGYLACQQRRNLLVKGPKFVHGHRFEITRFHFTNSDDFCPEALALLFLVAFEGLFGRFRAASMVEESQNQEPLAGQSSILNARLICN